MRCSSHPPRTAIEETLDALDGLVFSGGPDLDPTLYDAEPHPETHGTRPERDRAEIALLAAALERDMPVLAICRGSQVLNVALGGDLEQHVPDRVGHEGHKEVPGTFSEHGVESVPGTRLHRCSATRRGEVAPPPGLRPARRRLREAARRPTTARSRRSRIPSRRSRVGVLWHPEEGDDPRLFEELVEQARAYRARL